MPPPGWRSAKRECYPSFYQCRLLGFGRGHGAFLEREGQRILFGLLADSDDATLCQPTEQQLLREVLFYLLLDHAGEWAGAEQRIVALLCKPSTRFRVKFDRDVAVGELLLELQHELVDNPPDRLGRKRCEGDRRVEPVAEFRCEHAIDRFVIIASADAAPKADRGLGEI